MEQRPPSHPRVAWEEVSAPRAVGPQRQPDDVARVRPLPHISWLPVYEFQRDNLDFIVRFVERPENNVEEKLRFLDSVCELCNFSKNDTSPKGLETFCRSYELLENVRALLEGEPGDQLSLLMLHKCLGAITALRSVRKLLEGREQDLLQICFSSVFSLPPYEELQGLDTYLYKVVIDAMDAMLEALVLNCHVSSVNALLRDTFQMLLNYTTSKKAYKQRRVVGRIRKLSSVLAKNPSLANWNRCRQEKCCRQETCCPLPSEEIEIEPLGRVLGQLLLFRSFLGGARCLAMDAVYDLTRFLGEQKSRLALVDPENDIASASSQPWPCTTDMSFVEFLRISERTEVVLEIIKGMTASSSFNKMGARDVLNMVMANPDSWLVDVPELTKCIRENLESINVAPARCSVETLLLLMADRSPEEVVMTLLEDAPAGDSTSMAMWEVMLSTPHTLEKIIKLFLSKLQTKPLYKLIALAADRACTHSLDSMGPHEFWSEDSDDEDDDVGSYCKGHPNTVTACLFLDGLVMLSERPDTARKLQALMPCLTGMLNHSNVDIRTKALVFFRNMVRHLNTRTNSIVVRVVRKLRPLFDDDSRELRELSILFFTELLGSVAWYGQRRMRRYARRVLLPLFLRMSDPADAVAEAAGDAVLAIAELLGWEWLKHLAQTRQTWRIGERLLERDRTMVDKYLTQSLLYLKDPQPRMREAAVRFSGLAARSLRDPSEERMAEIGSALRTLEQDADPSTRALAAQTVLLLSAKSRQPRRCRALRSLCCWRR